MTDTTTIILASILLLLGILTPMASPFFRKRKIFRRMREEEDDRPDAPETESAAKDAVASPLPPLTVLLTAHDNAVQLERNLPAFLGQDYPEGFRVIVVADRDDAATVDVLKRFTEGSKERTQVIDGNLQLFSVNSQLYYTLLPDSSRYISRKKLAVTLGVKAAQTEWIVLTDPWCRPAGNQWLKTMAAATAGNNLVIGYTRYDEDTRCSRRFSRIHTTFYLMREDLAGTAYRTDGSNLMFRKSDFMHGEGYRGNLELIRGEYDFLVNKYAAPGKTALVLHPDAWMTEEAPSAKAWTAKRLFYRATRRRLQRSRRHRLLFNIDQTVLHLTLWALLAAIACGIATSQWVLAGAAGLSLLLNIILNDILGAAAIAPFDKAIPAWRIYFSRLAIVWRNLTTAIRYCHANKLDFTTHKQ